MPKWAAAVLADAGCEVFIGRQELVPPRLGVAALTPGQVGGEIFGVDLEPDPVEGDQVQGRAPGLDDQDGLVAVGGQRGLDDLGGRARPPPWSSPAAATGVWHASTRPETFPALEVPAELSAEAQVALDLAVPAGQGGRDR